MENSLNAKALILDLDGTIVDSRQAYLKAARVAFSTLGKGEVNARTAMEIPRRFELGLPLEDLIGEIDVNTFRRTYLKAYYAATVSETKPFRNVRIALRRLSGKAKLGLTTRRNVSKDEVISQLRRFRLATFFKAVVTAMDTVNPKPSPEALIECSKQLGVEVQECAVVGDSVVDIRAGRNAGAKTVAVLSGIFSRKELQAENPDLILESVKELPYFLE